MKRGHGSLLVAAVLVGCGGGGGDSDDGIAIPDTTVVLDDETLDALQSVSDDLATFTFSRSTAVLDDLAEGDVIVADVHAPVLPSGALRRVQAIDRSGSIAVTTVPASLAEAIERGSLRETVTLRADDIVPLRRGVTAGGGPSGLYFGLNDVVLFDGDGGGAANDQVVMNGNIAIEPDLEIVIDIDGFSLQEASVAIVGEVSGNVNIDARREAVLPGTAISLATINLTPITFFVGPIPVVITNRIDLEVGASGKVTARMNVGFQSDAEARVGFGYVDGSFAPIGEISPTASLELQSFEDGVAGTVKLFAGPRLRFGLYGMDVGFARVQAFVQADVDARADPWWCLSAGMEGSAGLDISIDIDFWIFDITIDLIEFETDPIGESVDLGCAEGPAPSSEPGSGGTGDDAIQTFARSYGGDNIDAITAVIATDDGGALLSGATGSFSPTPVDAWLVKVDALGHVSWELAYGDLNAATDIADMDDGYLMTAGPLGATVESFDLVRVDDNGALVWARRFTEALGVGASRVVRTEDGGFLVAGTRDVTTSADFFAARFDRRGDLLWARTYGGAENDEAYDAVATSDGGFLLFGQTGSFGVTFNAGWAVKLDADGEIEWQRVFDQGGNFFGYFALESPLGGYLIGGTVSDAGLLIRLDAEGAVTWARYYDAGSNNDYLVGASAYPDGTIGVVGSTGLGAAADLWALRVSDAGNVLWSRAVGGGAHESAGGLPPFDRAGQPVAVTADGGLLVAGKTDTFSGGFEDAWLAKLTGNGYVELDSKSGAHSVALTGDLVTTALPGAATTVVAQPLELTEETIKVPLLSTQSIVARQGGLP
jgi:hypothetical protein